MPAGQLRVSCHVPCCPVARGRRHLSSVRHAGSMLRPQVPARQHRPHRHHNSSLRRQCICSSLSSTLVGAGLFLTPGLLGLAYALIKGKGNLSDGLSGLLDEVSAGYFQPNVGGANIPVSEGKLSDLAGDQPLFVALYKWFLDKGGVYKLAFGPKAFIVLSDPVVVRHILKENAFNYDKGVLAEILEPIMGKGLIPADLETWKPRRRAIVPAFHKAYLEAMVQMFGRCTRNSLDKFDRRIEQGAGVSTLNMEAEFLNLGLDIIGLGVFNYDFGSLSTESPVIQAVYNVLKEAEHRSTFYIPYWNLPLATQVVPRQRRFARNMQVLNECMNQLIAQAKQTRCVDDVEALQARDYTQVRDPSLLRFLVDLRDADIDDRQLRDDLMTMLIAGHETTAAVLTWTLFLLMQHPDALQRCTAEVDAAVGDDAPGLAQIQAMPFVRCVLSESLRLYPQPPILIRRALGPDTLPCPLTGDPAGYPIGKGADLFISVYNLHRSPHLWQDPDAFDPDRYSRPHANPGFNGRWAGYRPEAQGSSLYPNEVSSDFAFIPFGGGARKCVGDQFAMTEATVALAMMLRRFSFEFSQGPEAVGMATGATIHTVNGLECNIRQRHAPPSSAGAAKHGQRQPTSATV